MPEQENLQNIQADHVLDTKGLSCPMPLLKVKKTLKTMKKGQVLEVHGTDPGSKNDIPNYCKKHGYQFLGYEDNPENYTRYLIQIE